MSDGDGDLPRGLRTCPGCGRAFALLYICERCGRCDELDLPRDADRTAPCCSKSGLCLESDWRADVQPSKDPKHITEQMWVPEQREDGVYLVGAEDRTVILKLGRPDHGSDLLIAGYITGIQALALRRTYDRGGKKPHVSVKRRQKPVEEKPSESSSSWLVVCSRCDKPKAPRGCVPVKDSEAEDYCLRSCPGYEEWPPPSRLSPDQVTKEET